MYLRRATTKLDFIGDMSPIKGGGYHPSATKKFRLNVKIISMP